MKPHLDITDDNLASMEAFAESNDDPIVMVNLMQVKPNAEYEDPTLNDCTGYEAFARYTSGSAAVRQEACAKMVWSSCTNAYWAKRKGVGHGGIGKVPER